MIRAGKLDREITLQRAHTIKNEFGTIATVWTAMTTQRAEIVQAETIESASEDGPSTSNRITFRLRWFPVTTDHRVLYAGDHFNIVRVKEIGRRRGVELTCEA